MARIDKTRPLEKLPLLEKHPQILQNPSVHYRVNNILPIVPILLQINPFRTLPAHLSKNHTDIVQYNHPVSFPMRTRRSFPMLKRRGCEVDRSPRNSTEVQYEWSYTSILPYTSKGQLFLDLYTSHLSPGLSSEKGTLFSFAISSCLKRDEVTECRKLQNEVLNDLYSSPNNVRVIKSRRMRWAGHVASLG
jgi:hypothetical protein